MFRLSMSSLLVLLLAMAACQQESPSQQAKLSAAPSAGTDETYAPAATDSQPVDVQVTKPTRRELTYQVTLPGTSGGGHQRSSGMWQPCRSRPAQIPWTTMICRV